MNRVDFLADNSLVQRITNLRTLINELSTYQRIGTHSVLPGRIFSGSTSDIHLINLGAGTYKTVLVTFTPISALFSNMSLVHRILYTETYSTASGGSLFIGVERLLPSAGTQTWNLYLNNIGFGNIPTVDVKLYFFVIGAGTFTANVLP